MARVETVSLEEFDIYKAERNQAWNETAEIAGNARFDEIEAMLKKYGLQTSLSIEQAATGERDQAISEELAAARAGRRADIRSQGIGIIALFQHHAGKIGEDEVADWISRSRPGSIPTMFYVHLPDESTRIGVECSQGSFAVSIPRHKRSRVDLFSESFLFGGHISSAGAVLGAMLEDVMFVTDSTGGHIHNRSITPVIASALAQ